MLLRSVRFKNFRSFSKGQLELGPGTTLLWGDVGAGKTSILYAIEMALFGFAEVEPTFLIRHRATTAEVALGLGDDAHDYVFSRRFHRHLRRGRDVFELDEKGTGLSTDGRLTLYPSTELRQRAIDLLGFPDNPNPRAHSDLWRWAVYVPQERMRQILDAQDAGVRLETIRKALGLERYRTAAENAQTVARALKSEAAERSGAAELLGHWEADLERSRTAIATSEQARADASIAVDHGRRAVAAIESERAGLEARRRELEGDRRERDELRLRLGAERDSLAGLERRREELLAKVNALDSEARGLEQATAELPGLVGAAAELASRRKSLLAELERAEEGRRALDLAEARRGSAIDREAAAERALQHGERGEEDAARRLETALAEGPKHAPAAPTPREVAEIEQELIGATTETERLAGECRHLEATLSDAAALVERGVCPTCGQPVSADAFEGHRHEVEAALRAARDAHHASVARRLALTAERGARVRYEQARLGWTEAEKRRSECRAACDRAATEILRLRAELEEARAERGVAERRAAEHAPRAMELAAARDRLRSLELDADRLERRTSELRGKAESARARRESVVHAAAQAEEVGADVVRTRQRIDELGERVDRLGGRLADASAIDTAWSSATQRLEVARSSLEQAVGSLRRSEGDLESARDRTRQAELHLSERRTLLEEAIRGRAIAAYLAGPFRTGLLELEHRLLGKAKIDFDRNLGRYFSLLIEDPALVARSDAEFSPSVEIDGELTPPEALSGGERTALALAFRLALGQIVRRAERLRLDTLILDEPTDGFSPEQVQRMGELIAELRIPQVILVSHEQLLGGVADRVVRVRKVDGASEIVEDDAGPVRRSDAAPDP